MVQELGIHVFRYPIPWHHVETVRGTYDWRFLDQAIPTCETLGLSIIADPLHHTSYPAWLTGGFLNEAFAETYVEFVHAFAERYPMVKTYVPFNEPTCTLDFCGYRGFWHPYVQGDATYVRMLRNTARASAEMGRMIKQMNPENRILHIDTFEHHEALDTESITRAGFLNERRFLVDELLLGRVKPGHSMHGYLVANHFSVDDLEWHQSHPVSIDERGGNYYPLSEEQLLEGKTHHAPSLAPRGLAEVAADYAARLPMPLSLTETNIQGSVADRISWLKYMLEQTEKLAARGIRFRQFAWYPLFDCAGWHCLLQGTDWQRDAQEIYSCDERWDRQPTTLSSCYRHVAKGANSTDLPAFRFHPRHERTLRAHISHMDWEWEDAPAELC